MPLEDRSPGLTAGPRCARVPCGARRPGRACKLGLSGLRQARPAALCAAAPGRLRSSAAPTGPVSGLRSASPTDRAQHTLAAKCWWVDRRFVGLSPIAASLVWVCAPVAARKCFGSPWPADPPTPGSPVPTSSVRPASARAVDRYRPSRPVGAAEERSRPGAAAQRAAGRACLRPTGPSLRVRPGRRAPQGTLAQQGPAVRPGRAVSIDSAAHAPRMDQSA